MMASVRGLPRYDSRSAREEGQSHCGSSAAIDTNAPVLAIISRYLVDEKTGDCCFFFQTQSEAEKQEWIK